MENMYVLRNEIFQNLKVEKYYEYTLKELKSIPDVNKKQQMIDLYYEDLEDFASHSFLKPVVDEHKGSSIEDIYSVVNQHLNQHTSTYFWPGDIVRFYPGLKRVKASQDITCVISGGIIKKGSYYLSYRPLLHNITRNERCVLRKTIKCEETYEDLLPQNIKEFENQHMDLNNSYNIPEGRNINYYNMYTNYGGGLDLQQLGKSKKIKK